MGKIVRRVLDGYVTLIEWSPSDPATVEAAEMIFCREVDGGYVAVVEDDGGHSRGARRGLQRARAQPARRCRAGSHDDADGRRLSRPNRRREAKAAGTQPGGLVRV